MMLNLFKKENYLVAHSNFQKLHKFGIYFSYEGSLLDQIRQTHENIRVVVGRRLFISRKTVEGVESFSITLKADAEIY
jgi:hypothetical protein